MIYHFLIRQASKDSLTHLILPGIGFLMTADVPYSMGSATWTLGLSWLAAGILDHLFLRFVLKRDVALEIQASFSNKTGQHCTGLSYLAG
ncbi:hypothetical protein [Deinococcus radiophilus]|uniref:hypothetical protein n=1 Tax=Deinococcus radiophilus TaxID=32062 RepID=UPI003621E98E